MTVLKNTMRRAIVGRILAKVRTPREVALRAKENALAIRMLRSRYGNDVFDRCRALPQGWLPSYKQLSLDSDLMKPMPHYNRTIYAGKMMGRVMNAIQHTPRSHIELAEYAVLPYQASHGWKSDTVPAGSPEHQMLYEWCDGWVSLAQEMEQLETQITATLAAYTTIEKLAVGWPEGYEELPQELLAETGNLPALRIDDLNARIAAAKEAA